MGVELVKGAVTTLVRAVDELVSNVTHFLGDTTALLLGFSSNPAGSFHELSPLVSLALHDAGHGCVLLA